MDPTHKSSSVRNILVRTLIFGVLVLSLRFAYIVIIRGGDCAVGDFCFFSAPESLEILNKAIDTAVSVRNSGNSTPDRPTDAGFYASVFLDLIAEGFLSPTSKSLCIDTPTGKDVFALKEVGVPDSIGISKMSSPPLVISGNPLRLTFENETFDFLFSGGEAVDRTVNIEQFAAEIGRTLKREGILVVHTASAKEAYSLNSFLNMFNCCRLVRSREIDGLDTSKSLSSIRELVLRKDIGNHVLGEPGYSGNNCVVPVHKRQLVLEAEPLIPDEPLKPWVTLKRNIKNIKYLPSSADISFRRRYVYVDVGARSFGSSIGSWFKKQYPKQNRTFEIFAIEADKTFHEEYRKKGVTLLPYAAWVRNETLSFEITRDPGQSREERVGGRGMGRIKPAGPAVLSGQVDKIRGFDFGRWLKTAVSEKDFVVMKMDIEGTEFELIPRLFETGSICLIDELFLECHYNRWQKCCPGERSSKYTKTYKDCLELFSSLRESGVLVHQWWKVTPLVHYESLQDPINGNS